MTQTGPAAQDDVLLPQGWSKANQASSLLFRLDGLELHLIPGSRFEAVADAVGTLRESTYRQQLSGQYGAKPLHVIAGNQCAHRCRRHADFYAGVTRNRHSHL